MKLSLIYIAAMALVLGSCATYRSGQTPDDVYYSPATERPADNYARQNNDATTSAINTDDGSTYVTYDDNEDDNEDDNGISYTQRIQMFDNPYGFSYSPSYFNTFYNPYTSFYNPYMSLYDPYMSLYDPYMNFYQPYGYGLGFGSYYSLGIGIGSGFYYGGYNPWSIYNPYWNPYYGYGYGYGLGSGKLLYNPRPGNTIAPRRSASSPAVNGVGYNGATRVFNTGSGTVNTNQPRRVFEDQPRNGVSNTTHINTNTSSDVSTHTRRVFRQSNDERPLNINTTNSANHSTIRVYRHNNNNLSQPAYDRSANNNNRTFQQQRVEPRTNTNYNNNSSSNNSGGGGSAPTRTFSPRR